MFIEWISIRLGSSAHRTVTKTVHKILQGYFSVCLKLGLVQLLLIYSKFIAVVVYYLFCITPLTFLVSMLSLVQDYRSN